jgi:EmrB/QacA subfamily drug resistance transporter
VRPPDSPTSEYLYAHKWLIWGVVMIGLFMALIDVTIVNISIPQLQRDLGAPVDTVSWVLNAYNIVFAVLLVSMGRLADQFGRRRFFLIGMTIFTVGSLLCALSASIGVLIAARAIQAIGAATLAPIALATTTLVFPPAQRGLGLALMAMIANFAAALGPPIGGVLVEFAGWPFDAGWHWIFLINVPIGVLGIALALRTVPETRDPHAGTAVDWWGMTTLGAAIFCLTFGLVEANKWGWGSPRIVALLAGAIVFTAAFALTQRYGKHPMLTRALVRNRQFVGACTTLLLFGIGMMGALFMIVLAFVNLWGYSEIKAALAVTPVAIMAMVVSPLVGRLSGRVPPRAFAVPALLVMAAGLFALSTLPAEPSLGGAVWRLALLGAGVGAAFPAVTIGSMGSIRGQEIGLGSGIVNMSRQVGFTIGIALFVAVFTGTIGGERQQARERIAALPAKPSASQSREIAREETRDAYGKAFLVGGFVVLLGIPFSLTMRRGPSDVHRGSEVAPAPAAG